MIVQLPAEVKVIVGLDGEVTTHPAPALFVTEYEIEPFPEDVAALIVTDVDAPLSPVDGAQVIVCMARPIAKVFVVETETKSAVSATVAVTEQDPAPVKDSTREEEEVREQPVDPALSIT